MADQTILQETLDNNIVDGDWLIYWKTSTGVQRRVARSSLLGATLTGAGTIATGGFTLTVPATGTAALKTGTPVANNVAQWDDANTVEDAGFAASNVALLDGSRTLTADWDIGDNRRVLADGVRARDGAGLRLEDDAGNLGVFVEDGGDVGIGTTSPALRLTVDGGTGLPATSGTAQNGLMRMKADSSDFCMDVGVDAATGKSWIQVTNRANLSGAFSNPLLLNPNGGLVGIGTTSPALRLTVDGGTGLPATSGTAQNGLMRMKADSSDFCMDVGVDAATGKSWIQVTNRANLSGAFSNPLLLNPNGGLVGIGTTSPGATLEVDQSSASAAIPTLHLRQADDDEEFIRFEATVGAGNAIDTAVLGSYYGKIRVNVDGVGDKFIALYNT